MNIEGIDHIAIAVHSLEEAVPFYEKQLGLALHSYEEVPEQKVRVAIFEVGGSRIELLEPTSEDSPISGFLAKRGPGLHHLALRTQQLKERLEDMSGKGVRLIDQGPSRRRRRHENSLRSP